MLDPRASDPYANTLMAVGKPRKLAEVSPAAFAKLADSYIPTAPQYVNITTSQTLGSAALAVAAVLPR